MGEVSFGALFTGLCRLIDHARVHVAQAADVALIKLRWEIGRRTDVELLGNARARYGEQIVATLSRQLVPPCAHGFTRGDGACFRHETIAGAVASRRGVRARARGTIVACRKAG